jgi:hypothetical protein
MAVSSFGYSADPLVLTRLVDGRINARKSDHMFMGFQGSDIP